MTEYNILAKLQIDTSAVDAKLKGYNPSISIKAKAVDTEKVKTQVGQLENQLNRLQIANKDAFSNSPAVRDQLASVISLKDGVAAGTTSLGEYRNAYGVLNNEVLKYNKNASSVVQNTDNIGTSFQKAISKIMQWGIATSLVYGALKQIKEGVQYIKDLNEQMTDIGLVTGQTTDQLTGMASQFNDMGKELGATTLDMAEGATEWINF